MNRTRFQLSKNVCIFKILWLCREICKFLLDHIEGNFEFVRRKDFFFMVDPGPAMAQQVLAERVVILACRKEAPNSLVT